ncbi:CAP domain-containing protein [Aureibacter tunicatorum]|uniref:Uncharacterized protein YkwD n=1 Tax=Aureibacter tunicatorum TaxID=866807 RepID=A0AAE4BRV3_9BACT|nr:CAP domain-containing protein [Aureibacter tunicatorum]MDR6238240.1 uncharacterized protein YkwD [Aureibacter tunicatorum]BDD03273.1 lipoprotein [Aureibacter tunicatorum]
MKRNSFFILFLLLSLSLSSCTGAEATNAIEQNKKIFKDEFFKQVNLARTQPQKYAEEVLKTYYDNKQDNGAYKDLMNREAISPLVDNELLETASIYYSKYLADNNVLGHDENGSPQERSEAVGYDYWAGENIAVGFIEQGNKDLQNAWEEPIGAAKLFVAQLIIDMGVPNLGHRKNILNATFTEMGVGFYRNEKAKYRNYVVQSFGNGPLTEEN